MASNLIYKGDTIQNFGRNLPVPYIDKIELYDVSEEDRGEAYLEMGLPGGSENL